MDTRKRRQSPVRWLLGVMLIAGGITAGLAWKPDLLPENIRVAIPGIAALGVQEPVQSERPEVTSQTADEFQPFVAEDFPEWAEVAQSEPVIEEEEFFPRAQAEPQDRDEPDQFVNFDVDTGPDPEAFHGASETPPQPQPQTPEVPLSDTPFGEVAPVAPNEKPAATPTSRAFDSQPSSFPEPTGPVPQVDMRRIEELLAAGDQSAAHRQLSEWYWKLPTRRPAIQKPLDELATAIYFTATPHFVEPYVIEPGDQLSKIARKFQLSWQYLAKLNRVDPRRIRPGQKLKVAEGPFSAVVDLSDFDLTVHCNGLFVRRYRVGIGKDNATPLGNFVVKEKLENPKYWGSDGNVKEADDPLNPLGERWIDIGDSFGIHGTIDPDSIGRQESKGCIRMLNSDVEEVYDLLTVGSPVRIQR